MTFSTDKFLDRSFNEKSYNCYDLVREAWLDLTGTDLGAQTPDSKSISTYTEKALFVANQLTELQVPENPCIVLMLRSRTIPHIGVYVNGKVLHLSRTGTHYVALSSATASFPTVKFYK